MQAKRGRKSLAELIAAPRTLEVMDRLKAPHDLNDEECEVWSAVVQDQPADWFSPSTTPLLRQYCRHVVQGRRIAEMIEQATSSKELSVVDYDRLLKMQERESRAILACATKMRIAQQSTTNHRGNKNGSPAKKPWEA